MRDEGGVIAPHGFFAITGDPMSARDGAEVLDALDDPVGREWFGKVLGEPARERASAIVVLRVAGDGDERRVRASNGRT